MSIIVGCLSAQSCRGEGLRNESSRIIACLPLCLFFFVLSSFPEGDNLLIKTRNGCEKFGTLAFGVGTDILGQECDAVWHEPAHEIEFIPAVMSSSSVNSNSSGEIGHLLIMGRPLSSGIGGDWNMG